MSETVDVAALLDAARQIAARMTPRRVARPGRERKDAIWRRAGRKCERCGCVRGLRVHHAVPISRGGRNHRSNLKLYCKPCEDRDHEKRTPMPSSRRSL